MNLVFVVQPSDCPRPAGTLKREQQTSAPSLPGSSSRCAPIMALRLPPEGQFPAFAARVTGFL